MNDGASLLIDDADAHLNGRLWIDPHLVTAKVHQVLSENTPNCSLVIRSGALRPHDIVTLYGLGADSINPYLLFATVNDGTKHQLRIYIMHLIKDWKKSFQQLEFMNCVVTVASILLSGYMKKSQNILQITNFLGSNDLAFSLESLAEDAQMRANDYNNPKVRMRKSFHIFPRIWKAIGDVAKGNSYDDYREN